MSFRRRIVYRPRVEKIPIKTVAVKNIMYWVRNVCLDFGHICYVI